MNDLRLTPRDADHLKGFEVEVVHGSDVHAGILVDESVTGVGIRLLQRAEIPADTSVLVRHGENCRDAVVQRSWLDADGATPLGLQWRAAQFR